jgi:hypothetical protein
MKVVGTLSQCVPEELKIVVEDNVALAKLLNA